MKISTHRLFVVAPLALVAIAAILIAGCGGGDDATTTTTDSENESAAAAPGGADHDPARFNPMAFLASTICWRSSCGYPIRTRRQVMPGIAHASLHEKNHQIVLHNLQAFFSQPEPEFVS